MLQHRADAAGAIGKAKEEQQGGSGILLADCQGLAVTPDNLGAGQLAVVNEFNTFEDALELAAELSGGRGRGARGGSGNLGAGGVTTVKDMQQLQLASYAVAAAPKMAAAYALNESAAGWDIDARSLYYCSLKGRTCKTGWDIPDAFKYIVDQAPELLRPARCIGTIDPNKYPDITDWEPYCAAARQRAAAGDCTADKITREKPLLKCSYRSLSNFNQMQQHIRNHGAIVSRIIMNDDWEVQFNESARSVSGLQWPAYKRNITAKAAFGHAVALVGYDNKNYQWIGINSWGSGTRSNERTRGITRDGLFKINMGLAGVGTPEQTYGVSCTVFPGNKRDLHGTPWLARQRRQVQPLNAAAALNVTATCYNYQVQPKETVASIVESLDLDYGPSSSRIEQQQLP
ncbi:hypothetical protein COO60DRAFT_1692748 [Scenedesmus sp. NREL 46B-D3]|nr:hypothetical protein COO60DRAFT_1692748 [Scenedesmus sp. NREL 46B-D3]